jgi:hypothetical protein
MADTKRARKRPRKEEGTEEDDRIIAAIKELDAKLSRL